MRSFAREWISRYGSLQLAFHLLIGDPILRFLNAAGMPSRSASHFERHFDSHRRSITKHNDFNRIAGFVCA